jgi:hypothetical protein
LAVQVHREIRDSLGASKLSITDIFRFPVLQDLSAHLDQAPKVAAKSSEANFERADARLDAMARRRLMRAGRMNG